MKNLFYALFITAVYGCSKISKEPEPAKPTPLAKVIGVEVKSVTPTSITLEWPPIPGAEGYKIYSNTTSGRTYTVLTPRLEDDKLSNNTSYTYQVSAYNKDGEGPKSDPITAKTTVPGLIHVVDDVKWVNYLNGRWASYADGEGLKYWNYVWGFALNSTSMYQKISYNEYITLISPQVITNNYPLKIEKDILYISYTSSSFQKYARLKILNEDEMLVYRISETGSSYKESEADLFTKVNSVERPKSDVIESTELKSIIEGVWSYTHNSYQNTTFDFSSNKNYYLDSFESQGARNVNKYEYKINSSNIISTRKWDNDFNPMWIKYKIRVENGKMLWYKQLYTDTYESKASYTLTKK